MENINKEKTCQEASQMENKKNQIINGIFQIFMDNELSNGEVHDILYSLSCRVDSAMKKSKFNLFTLEDR